MPNQRMNSDATLALCAKTGCAGYAGTLARPRRLSMRRISSSVVVLVSAFLSIIGCKPKVATDAVSAEKAFSKFICESDFLEAMAPVNQMHATLSIDPQTVESEKTLARSNASMWDKPKAIAAERFPKYGISEEEIRRIYLPDGKADGAYVFGSLTEQRAQASCPEVLKKGNATLAIFNFFVKRP